MNTRLSRISPGDIGLFLGFVGFVISIPAVIIAFTTIGPGKNVTLSGFASYTFVGEIRPIWILIAYPFANALGGMIAGFLVSWLYNWYARLFGGISVLLNQSSDLNR